MKFLKNKKMKDFLVKQHGLLKRRNLTLFLFNLGLGIAFTILLTAPAVSFLDSHILGYPHDGFAYIWKMWWARKAVFDLHISPANMSYINYPYEGYNPHLIASPLINVLALPLLGWLSPLRTYNILMLVAFALSWPTAAWLCYEFSHDRWASSVGGAVYAFFTNKVAHAVGGHLAQMFIFLFPLSALLLYRAWRKPKQRRNAFWAGLLLGLSALIDLKHIALFVAPFLGLFLLFYGITERDQWNYTRIVSVGTVLLVTALVTVPFLIPLIVGRLVGRLDFFSDAPGVVQHSADLTSFFIPPPEHPIYSKLEPLRSYSEKLASDGWHENIFYVGIVTFALSVLAGWKYRGRNDVRFWWFVAFAGMILALGPFLKVGNKLVTIGTNYVPLPYYLLQRLPFYDWGRTPGRVIGITMLALAVLASYGTSSLLSRIRSNYRSVATMIITGMILVDSLFVWPWPLGDAEVPAFYKSIAADKEDYAILDLPLWDYQCERYQLYYATIHGHRIVGGSVSRRPPEAEAAMYAVEQLVQPHVSRKLAEDLGDLNIHYVILHQLCLDDEELAIRTRTLKRQLGSPVYDDDWIRVFEVLVK